MTTVYIIRHAEIVYPLDDQGRKLMYPPETPISQEGRDQFTKFARSLKDNGIRFDVIESSNHARAIETAEILSGETGGVPIVRNPAFADSHIPGWIRVPLSVQQELMDRGEDIYDHPRTPDQETREQIAKRMYEGFGDLIRRNEEKTVALVSHGDPIRFLMFRLESQESEIPNMSILSKEGYLKRGEAFCVKLDNEGTILEKKLLSNLEGAKGVRELYRDNPRQMRK